MDEMKQFRRNANMLGLCGPYAQKWDSCGSKKQMIDLALDINSLAFIAESTAKRIGLTASFIKREFSQFINGKYINSNDGYTSSIYCQYENDEITVNTAAILVIDYKGLITIPANRPCELYLCCCDVEIVGDGNGIVYLYNSNVINSRLAPVVIKEDNKY